MLHQESPSPETGARRAAPGGWFVAVVLSALVLRVWEAVESSLWLDELHTLSHASQPTFGAMLGQVAAERVHVPLSFALAWLFGDWDDGAALRWIPIVASLLTLAPLRAFARESLGDARLGMAACWLFACLPYHVHWGTELRPYAFWTLFSAGAAWAAFSSERSLAARTAVFFVCALAGIWTHRLMAVTVFSIGVARLFVRGPALVPLSRLVVAGVLAFAPMVWWAVKFAVSATNSRLDYQEEVGGFRLRPVLIKEFLALPLRLVAPYMGALGAPWSWGAKLGVALVAAVAACGAGLRWRARAFAAPDSALKALTVFVLAHYAIVVLVSWWFWDRLPLQYFGPVAWALPILIVAWLDPRRIGACWPLTVVCAAALLLGVAQSGGRSTEDMRGAVAKSRELGASLERPIYTALLSQPSMFEHVLPYRAYGPELDFREPALVPSAADADFERTVIVLRRGQLPFSHPLWRPLLEGRRVVDERRVDAYISLYVLAPAR